MRSIKIVLALVLAASLITGCGKGSSTVKSSEGVRPPEGEVGELIEPDPDSEESDLGSYRYSHSGVKLYYDDTVYPDELMLAMEGYFTTFEKKDFESYKIYLYPGYAEEMETHLSEEYRYGLDTSFQNQCDDLAAAMGGDFKVTRIKFDAAEDESEESYKSYFNSMDTLFEKDYYSLVKNDADKMYIAYFYVMAEGSEGEQLLISDYTIVFAEKDGRYYTFG